MSVSLWTHPGNGSKRYYVRAKSLPKGTYIQKETMKVVTKENEPLTGGNIAIIEGLFIHYVKEMCGFLVATNQEGGLHNQEWLNTQVKLARTQYREANNG